MHGPGAEAADEVEGTRITPFPNMKFLQRESLTGFCQGPMMKRYAAKLLFQFRVMVDGDPGKRRLCEERIISFKAGSAQKALATAKRKGRTSQYRYTNDEGNPVHFEFIGVMELLCLDPECEPDEVWYDIVEHLLPLERKHRFIPSEAELNAIRLSE